MQTEVNIGEIIADVTLKDIKNIHLSVHPPTGRVRISAPERMDIERIRLYALSRLGWIKKQQAAFAGQRREPPRRFVERESHYFLGKRYLLKLTKTDGPQTVILRHREIEILTRDKSDADLNRSLLENFYRRRLRGEISEQIEKWSQRVGVEPPQWSIKKMKTKWGSCNAASRRIWINLELAKKPAECIEYIVVHELVHLLERNHNHRFITYINDLLPPWRQYKEMLNRLPLSHIAWPC